MRIIEEFWYGNIEPTEYDTSSCKEYKKLLELICRNEEKLRAIMTDEQKELFEIITVHPSVFSNGAVFVRELQIWDVVISNRHIFNAIFAHFIFHKLDLDFMIFVTSRLSVVKVV